ncbi:hypothetical protein M3P36_10870 [Altererythrobacter sp. KTW20L]|uniref:hypothetical protein n=1 Tax=Altererythrobacter sp. KTW20L TaxID=2942210 RepID=UPI0020BDC3BC|nr:hypothetical protein [Altererythrobacter sp. KTW20L]MCL6251540.1 hypothetical protein [Altererythrobacter sp. KTW20L]
MSPVIETIRGRLAEVDSRISKLFDEIKKAENERFDILTALRVLGEVIPVEELNTPVTPRKARYPRPPGTKRMLMIDALECERIKAKSPAEVHKDLVYAGVFDITIGAVRTRLWRMAEAGEIHRAHGRYWKDKTDA